MKIKKTQAESLRRVVKDAMKKAYLLAGFTAPSKEDIEIMIELTIEDLRKYYSKNDLDDIATAFEHGALGDYGENKGLSVARFHQWMFAFNGNATNLQQDDETPAIQEQRDLVKDGHDMVNSAYEMWLKRGFNLIPASVLLPWLIGDGIIRDFDERMNAATKVASEVLKSQFVKKRERYQKIGEFIRKNQETEAGSILVNTFFTECKEKGLTTIYQSEDVSQS